MLYQKMLSDKKAIMTPIAPSYVPSYLSTLSPTSADAINSSFKNGTCNNNTYIYINLNLKYYLIII